MSQQLLTPSNNYQELEGWLVKNLCQRVLVVCDSALPYQKTLNVKLQEIAKNGIGLSFFDDFTPNPQYESVVKGVDVFRDQKCDGIIAIGGGSAMDVAKCIKLYSNMDSHQNYLEQTIVPNDIPFLAIPTTAGTGSEATRYAVIYYNGDKQSITSESCIPQAVLLDPTCLTTLPLYQRKVTMLDALCHALESFWSVNSTEQSQFYSSQALSEILANLEGYLNNTPQGNSAMLLAAHKAGQAINITQTTAGHAMCYKLTSLFGIAHGHAAILCDRILFPWMLTHTALCVDPRGETYLQRVFVQIAKAMGCTTPKDAVEKLQSLFSQLNLEVPAATPQHIEELTKSVNPVRLKNHPIRLNETTIRQLYQTILR